MDASSALLGLMQAIDEHRWADLEDYLHPDFECTLLHTGESFDRTGWIRFNADYPDFDRLIVEESVASGDAAACRSHVTSRAGGESLHFACASFARLREGRILTLTEVWTDLDQAPPEGTRASEG